MTETRTFRGSELRVRKLEEGVWKKRRLNRNRTMLVWCQVSTLIWPYPFRHVLLLVVPAYADSKSPSPQSGLIDRWRRQDDVRSIYFATTMVVLLKTLDQGELYFVALLTWTMLIDDPSTSG